jgi:hypothetical protein
MRSSAPEGDFQELRGRLAAAELGDLSRGDS